MENNLSLPASGNSSGDAWLSQGKNIAKLVVGAALLCGIGYLGFLALPFLITGVQNLLTLVGDLIGLSILGAVLGVILYILFDKRTWQRLGYLYEAILEISLGWLVDFDPFVIFRHQIEEKEKDRETLKEEGNKVEGKKIELQEKIAIETQKAGKAQASIEVLKDTLKKNLSEEDRDDANGQIQLQVRNFGRSQEYIQTVTPYVADLSKISAFAKKAYKLSGLAIEDAKQELQMRQDMFSAVNSGERALQNAVKAFAGNSQTNRDAEFALNRIREKVGVKVANIHNCIDLTSQYMNAIELSNAADAKQIMAKIDSFNVEQAFGSDSDSKVALASGDGHFMGDTKVTVLNKYQELI